MGTWGTAISSNDTYADIYNEFFTLYDDGFDVEEISKKLISDNYEILNDTEDSNNFWFALAKAQWDCGQLEKELFERIKTIIETDRDIEVWRSLEADEKDIKKRKIILDKFLESLQTEKPKARPRKKKILWQPIFEKGDCLTFVLENGNYGGALVIESIKDSEYGLNLIATTKINQIKKPTITDFEKSNVLILNYDSWKNKAEIGWYYQKSIKYNQDKLELVGQIQIEIKYDPNDHSKGFYFGGSFEKMKEGLELQLEYENSNQLKYDTLKMKQFIESKNKRFRW